MQLADLAFGQGHQPHAGEAQLLVEGGDVLLVARQPVERLGDDDIEDCRRARPPAASGSPAAAGWRR